MGKLFAMLAWLKGLGLDGAALLHLWDDIEAVIAASDLQGRIRAIVHMAQHLKAVIPGEIDDAIIDVLAKLVGEDEIEEMAMRVGAALANPVFGSAIADSDPAIALAAELRASGLDE